MSKQNRFLMAFKKIYKPETQDSILKNMVNEIANDYAAMYNSALNPIKDVLNQLLMFGEGEGVLVTTAIKQLWEVNQEHKEENK